MTTETAVPGDTLVLASNGRSTRRIVIPVRPSAVASTAARELQQFVRQSIGVTLPIVRETSAAAFPGIYLGPTRRFQRSGLAQHLPGLAEDGVLYGVDGNDLLLSGQNERGQLYAVYELLERTLGIRFLAHDCTVVPKHRTWSVPRQMVRYASPFMYRETLYWDSFPKSIAPRQRLNGHMTRCDASVGGRIGWHPFTHSANLLVPPEKYFKDHPEYYSLVNGQRITGEVHAQLCWTNPDVLRIATAQVLQWMEQYPDIPIIDVSQNDGNGACECENCMKVVQEEGSQQGPILRFVNAIADVTIHKYPNRWVETEAYAYSVKPPAITKPRPNVLIRLAHAGCYFHGFEACGIGADFADHLHGWNRLTRRIIVWHYATNFGHYVAPNQNLEGLVKDIRFYADHGMNGVTVQANYQGPGGELAELRQYLSARLLWDPRTDAMTLRQEFCRGYYGTAASDVLNWLDAMDRAGRDPGLHGFGAWDPSDSTPPALVQEGLRILSAARRNAGSAQVDRRVRKLLLPLWYMQVTWPAKYGLSDAQRPAVIADIGRIIRECRITHICEGGPEENATGWLAKLNEKQ